MEAEETVADITQGKRHSFQASVSSKLAHTKVFGATKEKEVLFAGIADACELNDSSETSRLKGGSGELFAANRVSESRRLNW